MKYGLNILIGVVVIGMATLTACGKSGGGGGGAASTPAAACAYDSSGNCVAGVGAAGYMGDGQWSANLVINTMTMYQTFAYENGLCGGQDCAYLSGYLNLRLVLQTGGCLPGPGNFAISTFSQGSQGRTLSQRADAYANAAQNGFLLNYTSRQGQNGNTFGAPGPTTTGTLGNLQINTQFIDATHNTMNVQLVYRGQQIASGTMVGQSQYNANGATQSAAYCSSTGYTQNQNGYYGNTTGGGYYGNGGVVNPYYPNQNGGGYYYNRPVPVSYGNGNYGYTGGSRVGIYFGY